MLAVQPGDVLVTRHEHNNAARLIRLGAALEDKPDSWNHVIIAHHVDKAGTFWGVEGRAGGVGWVDMAGPLADRWTIANYLQPKDGKQRGDVCAAASAMLGVKYDWVAIAVDAQQAIAPLWHQRDEWGPGVPGHVVCSSLADWCYEHVGLPSPKADRYCTPADWAAWIQTESWH